MSTLKTPSKKTVLQHQRQLRVAEDFISAFVLLSESDKAYVEQFLALSAYSDASMDHYTPGSKRRCVESEHSLCYCVAPVKEAWTKWAGIIKNAKLTEFERLESVRMMLGVLILQKGKFHVTESELREAAEGALKWTGWDENNRAMARLRNSPEYKSCLDAIASRIDIVESIKQYGALVSKFSV